MGGVGCANSLGDTVWSQRVGHQQFQPSIGLYGGQWTLCALPKQMQPHPHSELPIGVQTTDVLGSFQTDQCILWGNLSRGSDTPPLHAGPLVHGLWGEPVGGVECLFISVFILHFINLLTLFIQNFSTCHIIYCHHHPLNA